MTRMPSALVAGLLAFSAPLSAHHSSAEYDRSVVHEIEGELVALHWGNPHVMFTVRVETPDGVQDWELESGSVYGLERAGLEQTMFETGSGVRAAGAPSTRHPSAMRVSNILLPTGEEVLLAGDNTPRRWSETVAGGGWTAPTVDRSDRSFFRVWSIEDMGSYSARMQQIEVRLTEAAEAQMTDEPDFDPCEAQGMPSVMMNPLPIEFIDHGDTIELRLSTFGAVRSIDMTDGSDPDSVPASDLGYSRGRIMGDTLEVTTTRVSWPYVDDAGRPQTEDVQIFERFMLVDEGNRLRYMQTVTDPAVFLEPVTASWDWIDIGENDIEALRCE